MNRCKRTSKLLDLARRVRSETIDAATGAAGLLRRTWKKLGSVKLLPGRGLSPRHRERKVRDRGPARTYAQRRARRLGWQD